MDVLTVGSLFAGVGGLEKGLEATGRFETVWQVEIDDYATRVLERHWPGVERIRDVRAFVAYANRGRELQPQGRVKEKRRRTRDRREEWRRRHRVDLICGGFPCPPVSVAGRRRGMADDRWLWPEFRRIVGTLRPRYVLVENVRGLLSANSGRAFGGILRDLAQLGYDAWWTVLPAAAFGAPHIRERVFIVAHAQRDGRDQWGTERAGQFGSAAPVGPGDVAHATGEGRRSARAAVTGEAAGGRSFSESSGTSQMADAHIPRLEIGQHRERLRQFAATVGARQWSTQCRLGVHSDELPGGLDGCGGWECGVPRVASGQRDRVNRLRCLGNAVVPIVAEYIGRMIADFHDDQAWVEEE